MRGRKPTPTKLRVLRGNPGKRPLNQNEPRPRQDLPKCPKHLSAEGRKEWRRVLKELAALGLVTQIDRAALTGYCDAWARFVEASLGLQKHGMLVKGRLAGEPVRSPYLAVVNQSLEQMKSFLIEFGMTPSSRERLSVQMPREPSAFEKFLAGGPPPNQLGRVGGNHSTTESDD